MKPWEQWLRGLISALISGSASAVTVVVVAPETFNLKEGLEKLIAVITVGAIVGVANYLKQSPLPSQG